VERHLLHFLPMSIPNPPLRSRNFRGAPESFQRISMIAGVVRHVLAIVRVGVLDGVVVMIVVVIEDVRLDVALVPEAVLMVVEIVEDLHFLGEMFLDV